MSFLNHVLLYVKYLSPVKKKLFDLGLSKLWPSSDRVFTQIEDYKELTGAAFLLGGFLPTTPDFTALGMALPLHPISTYPWLKWKLRHLLFAHLYHTVPRCIPLSLCRHAGSYNSCYFQPFLLRENNSVSC